MTTVDSGASPSSLTGSVLRSEAMSRPHRLWARSILVSASVIAAACILAFAVRARNNSNNVTGTETGTAPGGAVAPALVSTAADQMPWSYSTEKAAAGPAERVGCVQSVGRVFLGEPYDSEHTSLCFRSDGMAYLKLDGEGRVASGAGHEVKVRIGDGPAQKLGTLKPGDRSLGLAILSPAASLFAAARTGKPITVTAIYDDDLEQTVTFAPQEPLHLGD